MSGIFQYIQSVTYSDTGLCRLNNEDSCASLPEAGCFLVSDGMGGGSAGEIASQIVMEYITGGADGTHNDSPGLRKYEIQQAIHKANQKIQIYSAKHHFQQMGATLVLFLADSWNFDNAYLCHVGDSRVYRFRNQKLEQLTRDHSVENEIAQKRNIIPGDHKHSMLAHILTRAIGTSPIVFPDWQETDLQPCDIFMLCSDGVSTMLSGEELQLIFRENKNLDLISNELISQINGAGAKDNFTFILLQIGKEIPSEKNPSEDEYRESDYLKKIAEERIEHD